MAALHKKVECTHCDVICYVNIGPVILVPGPNTQVRYYEKQTLEAKNQLKIMENRFNELQKENLEQLV